ncbi:MAG: dynamin family protein [Desulfobacterales bacterium]|nr:dynamin family protein [Desulfobacterales bacterium]
MIDTYKSFKDELLNINRDLLQLFSKEKYLSEMFNPYVNSWERACRDLEKQMSEEILRVAVIGAIKSGKSTFVNSLFRQDYLKRGAGVVTSIVTRVRSANRLKAKLYFKSWKEVNSEIEQAMVLFPSLSWRSESKEFDIRKNNDRIELHNALKSLDAELLFNNGTRNANSVLISAYLEGYEKIKKFISDSSSGLILKQLEGDLFSKHKDFVGDSNLAVYLKDIVLEINNDEIAINVEIADCQGSDSSNPLHLSMIQDYLLLTHFIVYVISSRTGLRQADIKFLYILKKIGMLKNIFFIVNFDFSEHDSIHDLKYLIEKIRKELELIITDPKVYTISALFNLFRAQENNLSEKDKLRFAQWKTDKELSAFSDQETKRFEASFHHKLNKERYSLLLKNHIERLAMIGAGFSQQIFINKDIIFRDAKVANAIIDKLKQHQLRVDQIKSMIKSTFDGAVPKLKEAVKADIDRFFDIRSGEVLKGIIKFVRSYSLSNQKYEKEIKFSGFSNTLYKVFQEFKHELDTFMAETVNPELIRLICEEEKKIGKYLESVVVTYDPTANDLLSEYHATLMDFGINRAKASSQSIQLPSIDSVRFRMGLTFPATDLSMRYTAKMKTEAVMHFGFYKIKSIFKKLLKKPVLNKNEESLPALKDGISRMKREIERSVISNFEDYKENIKFQYIFKLIEGVSNSFCEALYEGFQLYNMDLSKLVELTEQKRINKQQLSALLKEMEQITANILDRLNFLRQKIEQTL